MEWRQIKDFPNYSISDEGQIRNDRTGTIRVLTYTEDGYAHVTIVKDGKTYSPSIHRLVLQTFCPVDNPNLQVNHINKNRADNRLSNLEWVTKQENLSQRNLSNLKSLSARSIIVEYTNGIIKEYPSVRECGRQLGISKDTVIKYIQHQLTPRRKIQANFYYK